MALGVVLTYNDYATMPALLVDSLRIVGEAQRYRQTARGLLDEKNANEFRKAIDER